MKTAPYSLTLTEHELESLHWLAARGYFPTDLADHLSTQLTEQAEENSTHDRHRTEYTLPIPEHVAWSLIMLREEDPDAYLACLGGDLLDRVLKLESEIV